MGIWETALGRGSRKAMLLRWIDTDKGDAGRPNYRDIKKATKKSGVPTAAELLTRMPTLESVKALFSLFVSHRNACNVRHQPCAPPWSTSGSMGSAQESSIQMAKLQWQLRS